MILLNPSLDIGNLSKNDISSLITLAQSSTTLEELVAVQNKITLLAYAKDEFDFDKKIKVYTQITPDMIRTRKVHNQEWIINDAQNAIFTAEANIRQAIADSDGELTEADIVVDTSSQVALQEKAIKASKKKRAQDLKALRDSGLSDKVISILLPGLI